MNNKNAFRGMDVLNISMPRYLTLRLERHLKQHKPDGKGGIKYGAKAEFIRTAIHRHLTTYEQQGK